MNNNNECFWLNGPFNNLPEQRQRIIAADKCRILIGSIDGETKTATINGHYVTLEGCNCRDHIFRKAPCKHMYRLASELGLINLADYRTFIADDQYYWGGWDALIHKHPDQKARKERLYEMCNNEVVLHQQSKTAKIRSYSVSLNQCTCEDFQERKLPCKHIYRLAFELGLPI